MTNIESMSPVVKAVAKKLKYYLDVKRLEDGFDLSDSNSPVLAHPPLKTCSVLPSCGLHDRAVKHYFSQPDIRVQLTQMASATNNLVNARERRIKKALTENMSRRRFLATDMSHGYYINACTGLKSQTSLAGFQTRQKVQRKQALKGGWPVLKMTPPPSVSRNEAERLVNSATRILAATEAVEQLSKRRLAPSFIPTHRRSTGLSYSKRQLVHSTKKRSPDYKHISAANGSCVFSPNTMVNDNYLNTASDWPLTPSGKLSTCSTISPDGFQPSHRSEPVIINAPVDRVLAVESKPQICLPLRDTGMQTERQLLEEYDYMEEEVRDGSWAEYRVTVRTGDRVGANTSATVFVTLYGEKGRTPSIHLDTSLSHNVTFQRGKEDVFVVSAFHVGDMKKIKIGHNHPQICYAWFLDMVTIYDLLDRKVYDFPFNCWLSGKDGDHKTYQTLFPDQQRVLGDELCHPVDGNGVQSALGASHNQQSLGEHEAHLSSNKFKFLRNADRSSSLTSSSVSSESASSNDGSAVKVSVCSSPRVRRTEYEQTATDSSRRMAPVTVIQFKKKGSQKVVEEVVIDEQCRDELSHTKRELYSAEYETGLGVSLNVGNKRNHTHFQHDHHISKSDIHYACRKGNLDMVKDLLDKFPEMRIVPDESGLTPLHIAAANGKTEVVNWLLSSDQDDPGIVTAAGYTPCHVAAINGHTDALMVLKAMGADIDLKAADKQTPLHLAAQWGHLDSVRWLTANGARVSTADDSGRTARDLAGKYQHCAVFDLLTSCEKSYADHHGMSLDGCRAQHREASIVLPTIAEDDKVRNEDG